MTELRLRAKRIQKSLDCILAALAALMKRKVFGVAAVADRFELFSDLSEMKYLTRQKIVSESA